AANALHRGPTTGAGKVSTGGSGSGTGVGSTGGGSTGGGRTPEPPAAGTSRQLPDAPSIPPKTHGGTHVGSTGAGTTGASQAGHTGLSAPPMLRSAYEASPAPPIVELTAARVTQPPETSEERSAAAQPRV